MRTPHDTARAFISASEAGVFPDGLCCDDMTAWTTLQSEHGLSEYAGSVAYMREKTGGTLAFIIDAVIEPPPTLRYEPSTSAQSLLRISGIHSEQN